MKKKKKRAKKGLIVWVGQDYDCGEPDLYNVYLRKSDAYIQFDTWCGDDAAICTKEGFKIFGQKIPKGKLLKFRLKGTLVK